MDRFAAIRIFSQVVESGSFAKAAEHLGLSTSAASRHVAELEAHLQTRLLNRTTRRVRFGPVGGYLHFQYFNGYGENILDYNVRRKWQFRVGFAIVP